MRNFQSNNHVLIISNDSFFVGLLSGYCIANQFTHKCIPRSKPLNTDDVDPTCKVIIIDLRELTSALIEAHLEELKQINNQYAPPICAIHNHSSMSLNLTLPWADYYEDETFIEKLDNYINKYIFNMNDTFHERRNSDRRSESDRRTLSGTVNSFSSKRLDGKTKLLNRDLDREFLDVFEIDKECNIVYLKGKDLELTGKEFKLFTLLAEDPESVFTTEKIIDHLWPNKCRANKSDLYQYMHLLRRKVELDPDKPRWILTVKGVGYKLHV